MLCILFALTIYSGASGGGDDDQLVGSGASRLSTSPAPVARDGAGAAAIPDISVYKENIRRELSASASSTASEAVDSGASGSAPATAGATDVPPSPTLAAAGVPASVESAQSSAVDGASAANAAAPADALPPTTMIDDAPPVLVTESDAESDAGAARAHRTNFAAQEAGALIMGASAEWTGINALLTPDADSYALSRCDVKKWVTIGLSEDLLVDELVIANEEKYASSVATLRVVGAQKFPTTEWFVLGNFTAAHALGEQNFRIDVRTWVRYLKVTWLSHYGNEFYCTWTRVKVHGSTMLEELQNQMITSDAEVLAARAHIEARHTAPAPDALTAPASPSPPLDAASPSPAASASADAALANDGAVAVVNASAASSHGPSVPSAEAHAAASSSGVAPTEPAAAEFEQQRLRNSSASPLSVADDTVASTVMGDGAMDDPAAAGTADTLTFLNVTSESLAYLNVTPADLDTPEERHVELAAMQCLARAWEDAGGNSSAVDEACDGGGVTSGRGIAQSHSPPPSVPSPPHASLAPDAAAQDAAAFASLSSLLSRRSGAAATTAVSANVFKTLTRKLKDLEIDATVTQSYLTDLHTRYGTAISSITRDVAELRENLQAVTNYSRATAAAAAAAAAAGAADAAIASPAPPTSSSDADSETISASQSNLFCNGGLENEAAIIAAASKSAPLTSLLESVRDVATSVQRIEVKQTALALAVLRMLHEEGVSASLSTTGTILRHDEDVSASSPESFDGAAAADEGVRPPVPGASDSPHVISSPPHPADSFVESSAWRAALLRAALTWMRRTASLPAPFFAAQPSPLAVNATARHSALEAAAAATNAQLRALQETLALTMLAATASLLIAVAAVAICALWCTLRLCSCRASKVAAAPPSVVAPLAAAPLAGRVTAKAAPPLAPTSATDTSSARMGGSPPEAAIGAPKFGSKEESSSQGAPRIAPSDLDGDTLLSASAAVISGDSEPGARSAGSGVCDVDVDAAESNPTLSRMTP